MAKIIEMTDLELQDAMIYMAKVPVDDKCYTGWNFDSSTWRDKFNELITEAKKRADK